MTKNDNFITDVTISDNGSGSVIFEFIIAWISAIGLFSFVIFSVSRLVGIAL